MYQGYYNKGQAEKEIERKKILFIRMKLIESSSYSLALYSHSDN